LSKIAENCDHNIDPWSFAAQIPNGINAPAFVANAIAVMRGGDRFCGRFLNDAALVGTNTATSSTSICSKMYQGCRILYIFAYQKHHFCYILEGDGIEILAGLQILMHSVWYMLWSLSIFVVI
jgi:hypothetical protein